MENVKYSSYAPSILRLFLGMLFIIPGFQKLANPSMIIGMLGGLGFPAPNLFGWLLLLSEIGFGTLILIGWKLNYTVWPLVTILGVATMTVHIPAFFEAAPMALITVILHLLAIAALINLYLSGPGAFAVKRFKVVLTEEKPVAEAEQE